MKKRRKKMRKKKKKNDYYQTYELIMNLFYSYE